MTAPVIARATPHLLGGRIDVTWTDPPPDTAPPVAVRVLRRERGHPRGPDDGDLIYAGPVVERVVDTAVRPGVRYYYTVFGLSGGAADGGARADALATGHADLPEVLYRLLPAVHQREDRPLRPDELAALPTLPPHLRTAGPLRRFLEALAAPLALARSTAEALPQLRDPELAPPAYLPLLAGFLDAPLDATVPVYRRRSELRSLADTAQRAGTVGALQTAAERVTGWQARISEYAQNIALSNDPPRRGVFALRRVAGSWVGLDDIAPELGFGPGGATAAGPSGGRAVLVGTRPGPFTLRAGAELTVAVDGRLPTTVRLLADERDGDPGAVAATLDRLLPEVDVAARPDGRLELRSPPGSAVPSLTVSPSEASPVTIAGAPAGRVAALDAGPGIGVLVVNEVTDADGRRRLEGSALDAAIRGVPVPIPQAADAARGAPALALLPGAPRLLLVWVADPGTDHARLRLRTGVVAAPRPAVLTGTRAGVLPVPSGSRLVLRDGHGQARGIRFAAADFADPAAPRAHEVVSVLTARLGVFAAAELTPAGAVALRSPDTGPEAVLAVDAALSDAAAAIGLAGTARGNADDLVVWVDGTDRDGASTVAGLGPGRLADPVLAVAPDGTVVLAVSRHDGTRWQVVTAEGNGTTFSAPVTVSGPTEHAIEPALAVSGGQLWIAWAGRDSAAGPWSLRAATRGPGGWSTGSPLVPAPAGFLDGDRQPTLLGAAGPPDVVFASDRADGTALWTTTAGAAPTPVTAGPAADGWPTVLRVGGEARVLFRSDRNLVPSRLGRGRGTDTGTVLRRAGTTAVVTGDLTRLRAHGEWGDLTAYTPHRPDGADLDHPLRDDERYLRGTVGLHLLQTVAGPLDAAAKARLGAILPRVVPITVRVLVHLASPPVVEHVYPNADGPTERVLDRHPEVEHLDAVAERSSVVGLGWRVLHSATPSLPPPADPRAGGVSADPAAPESLRGRTAAPPLE